MSVAESSSRKSRVEEQQLEIGRLHSELSRARDEVMTLKSAPKNLQYAQLEQKITAIEDRNARREAELQKIVHQVYQKSAAELAAVQRQSDIVIAMKNAEIQRFRAELDVLVATIKRAQKAATP